MDDDSKDDSDDGWVLVSEYIGEEDEILLE